MLHPASGRIRPSTVVPSKRRRSPNVIAFTRGAQSQKIRAETSLLRSAHGAIFSPVMRAATGFMGWRLQHDGFAVRDVRVPGGHVRLWDAKGHGKGPCVVFIHGLGGSCGEYRDTLVWLQSRCRRVIAVDMPGHGGSSPIGRQGRAALEGRHRVIDKFQARINIALDKILNEPANLVGHSLGGYAVMRYALEGSKRSHVAGLVLVSPDGAPWTRQELADDNVMFAVSGYAAAGDIASRTYPKSPLRAALITPFVYARFGSLQMQYLNHSDAKQPVLLPAQLRALCRRVLLIFGKNERFDPPHNLAYFRAHLPPSMTLAQPETGHGDIVDAHPELLGAMAQFIDRC